MKPSKQFVRDVRASCEAQLAARMHVLTPYILARVRPGVPSAVEIAMTRYRELIVEHAMCWLLNTLATCPDDLPEENAKLVLDAMIGDIPPDRLNDLADLAIHPPLAEMH